jgi:hypothetical protein
VFPNGPGAKSSSYTAQERVQQCEGRWVLVDLERQGKPDQIVPMPLVGIVALSREAARAVLCRLG